MSMTTTAPAAQAPQLGLTDPTKTGAAKAGYQPRKIVEDVVPALEQAAAFAADVVAIPVAAVRSATSRLTLG